HSSTLPASTHPSPLSLHDALPICRRATLLGIRRQRPRHQLKPVIHPRRNPVYRSNERSRPAADHPQPQPPPRSINLYVCRHILRSEEHTSELQSRVDLVCRLLLEK